MTMVTLALTAGSTLFGLSSMKAPPPPELPAVAAPTARTAGATVRVGTGADELENTDATESSAGRTEKTRASGMALGGLGRSSLAL